MNVKVISGGIHVTLSRRNLRDLLANADGQALVRQCGDLYLRVEVQSDEQHYGVRKPGPGISADHNE